MAKKLEGLFASTLNGMTASVRCVSSIIVILNAKLTQLIAAHANKKDDRKRRNPTRVVFLLFGKHKCRTSTRSLGCARGHESAVYFRTIYAS